VTTRVLDIRTPGVRAALAAPLAVSAWEVLRRIGKPTAADHVAAALSANAAVIREALDGLAEVGIIDKLPIRENRRQPAYRTNGDALAVEYEPADGPETDAVREIRDALRKQVEASHRTGSSRAAAVDLAAWRSVHLEPDECEELLRLLREALDLVEAAQSRITNASGAEATKVNVHVLLEVRGADGPAPPVPAVHFSARGEPTNGGHLSTANAMERLSPREREIALLLVNGRSRPEIAKALGVSINTVATITKRIYAKLGVRRRVELSNRIRRGRA